MIKDYEVKLDPHHRNPNERGKILTSEELARNQAIPRSCLIQELLAGYLILLNRLAEEQLND